MATLTYIDTHVAVWLYLPRLELFSSRALSILEEDELLVSPAVMLELEFLHEIGRLRVRSGEILESLHVHLGLRLCDLPFSAVVSAASGFTWTRDPFDRLIVGHAIAGKRQLLTCDESIHEHFEFASW